MHAVGALNHRIARTGRSGYPPDVTGPDASSPADDAKRRAAAEALRFVEPGMRLGLGTGSTAAHFVDLLGVRVRDGLPVVGVPTSTRTAEQARALDISLTTLDATPELDLTVDGADAFDPQMRLVKGGGGALLREKIVAAASRRMIVIADRAKEVERLGRFPLPVEVEPFGLAATTRQVEQVCREHGLPGAPRLRTGSDGAPFVTDGGHRILDSAPGLIDDPVRLAAALDALPGVLGHGLFVGLATAIIVADEAGFRIIGDPQRDRVRSSDA